jgi:hypothetical protein
MRHLFRIYPSHFVDSTSAFIKSRSLDGSAMFKSQVWNLSTLQNPSISAGQGEVSRLSALRIYPAGGLRKLV